MLDVLATRGSETLMDMVRSQRHRDWSSAGSRARTMSPRSQQSTKRERRRKPSANNVPSVPAEHQARAARELRKMHVDRKSGYLQRVCIWVYF